MTYGVARPRSYISNKTRVTDIVTYRYNGKLVYVPAVPNYNQALSHARDAFPQLRDLGDASLTLSLTFPGHEHEFVNISAPAWPKIVAHMSRYQIIDVHTTVAREPGVRVAVSIPEITITYADSDAKEREPVPPYDLHSEGVDHDFSFPYYPRARARTLSTSTLRSVRKRPGSGFFRRLGEVFDRIGSTIY